MNTPIWSPREVEEMLARRVEVYRLDGWDTEQAIQLVAADLKADSKKVFFLIEDRKHWLRVENGRSTS